MSMDHGDVAQPNRTVATDATHDTDQTVRVEFRHRVHFGSDMLNPSNPMLADILTEERSGGAPARCIAFLDEGFARHWPDIDAQLRAYAAAHPDAMTLVAPTDVVPGGEAAKNDWSIVERVTRAIDEAGICRQSYVIVFGGGAVLDAVGFGAAIAHRGVRVVRFPTTTLAQDDSGIGVKNGVNAFGKKNFLGSFGVPWAVLNDASFLSTLSDRDCRAGLSEAIKVALLKDKTFFDSIAQNTERLVQRDAHALADCIRRSAQLHLEHIVSGGDPFEQSSARPLDFGHWSAHKLEQMTDFELRHGEAVAIGLALDVAYSALDDRLPWDDAERVFECLEQLGFALFHPALDQTDALLEGLNEFREHLGGELTITLLNAIGDPVDVHAMSPDRVLAAIKELANRHSDRANRKHAS